MKIIELFSLGMFSTASLIANAISPHVPQWLFQFGALGLCGFMVFQNYNQQRALARIIEQKDDQITALVARQQEIIRNYTSAMNRLAQALEDRPCISDDQRIIVNE